MPLPFFAIAAAAKTVADVAATWATWQVVAVGIGSGVGGAGAGVGGYLLYKRLNQPEAPTLDLIQNQIEQNNQHAKELVEIVSLQQEIVEKNQQETASLQENSQKNEQVVDQLATLEATVNARKQELIECVMNLNEICADQKTNSTSFQTEVDKIQRILETTQLNESFIKFVAKLIDENKLLKQKLVQTNTKMHILLTYLSSQSQSNASPSLTSISMFPSSNHDEQPSLHNSTSAQPAVSGI